MIETRFSTGRDEGGLVMAGKRFWWDAAGMARCCDDQRPGEGSALGTARMEIASKVMP